MTSTGGWLSATMETQHSSASSLPLSRTVNVPEGTPCRAACATGEDRAIFSVVGIGVLGALPSLEAGAVGLAKVRHSADLNWVQNRRAPLFP